MTVARKEYTLEGLDCAHCAVKIEKEVNLIQGVQKATINFMTKTAVVEFHDSYNSESMLEAIKKIIEKHEPDVTISEKNNSKLAKKSFEIQGLHCANCAAKMEKEIGNIEGVKEVRIDFLTSKMTLEAYKSTDLTLILQKAYDIINRIEEGVQLVDLSHLSEIKREHHDHHEHDLQNNLFPHHDSVHKAVDKNSTDKSVKDYKRALFFAIGTVLFITGLLLNVRQEVEFIVFFTSYILVGGDIVLKALKNIFRGQLFDENFLMFIATVGAFGIGEFPEAVAVMLFFQIGEYFQEKAVDRSRRSISDLMNIRPDYANLLKDKEEWRVSPEEVRPGQIIVIKPGEKVPLDGIVIEGSSVLDTSALTGEFVPREVQAGSEILAGFINKSGLLHVKVMKEYGESTVARILDLVENASSNKAPTEKFITKFARYYTPGVVIGAVLLAVLPPLLIPGATFTQWFTRALVFLVVSCPCALVISIPLSFFGGIGGASRNGILVKGSNYLEALNQVKTLVFDKTGTLTEGVFEVTRIQPNQTYQKEELLEYAAFAEVHSTHPIATSIVKSFGKEVDKSLISDYEEISGLGVKAIVKQKKILAGSARLLESEGIVFEKMTEAGSIVYIAIDGQYAGSIAITDRIRKDVLPALQGLRKSGIQKIVMLTGDNQEISQRIGRELGFDEVYAELLPDQKVTKLEELDKQKEPGTKLAFVGDGINDAPVLARADIGIAMGGLGSDAAIEAADIVLMTDEPSKVLGAVHIARKTRKIVWQNIIFAFGVKGAVLILGAFGVATMWEAVFADVGVAVIAILNAMRVLKMDYRMDSETVA